MKKSAAIALLAGLILSACNAIEKRVNDKEDIANGTKVADEFITHIKAKDYPKAMELTQIKPESPEYQKNIDVFKSVTTKLGDMVAFKQDSAKTDIAQEGNTLEGTFTLNYTIKYQHGQTKEDYILTYIDNEIKIMSYSIENE